MATLSSEQKSHIWRIPNFAEKALEMWSSDYDYDDDSEETRRKPRFEFEMCAGKRVTPLKWECVLDTRLDHIGMWVSAKNLPPGLKNAHARIQCQIPGTEDAVSCYFDGDLSFSFDIEKSDGFPKLLSRYSSAAPLLRADGSLEIRVTVTVFRQYLSIQNSELAALEAEYKDKFAANHRAQLLALRKDPLNTSAMSTTSCNIVFKDCNIYRKAFPADRAILHARSPVFKAMFQSGMSEVEGGVVEVKDIDSKPLRALLRFLHTGELPKNWKEEGVIEGVIYGAHKYMLEDLKQFLDKALGLLCTEQNCGKLAGLAKAFGMKTAEEQLLKYFNENISKSLDDVLRFAEETANAAMLIAQSPESLEGTGEEPTAKKSKIN